MMDEPPRLESIDITEFTVGAMLRAGLAVRRVVKDADTMEEASNAIVRFLYDELVGRDGARACALVRLYKTHAFETLPRPEQEFARAQLGAIPLTPGLRCLALLATAGDEEAWNSRELSRGHRAIPLPSAETVRAAPMIARLLEQLGVDMESVIHGGSSRPREGRTYDIFHVPEALGSAYIPAQDEFVAPYGIRSVVGFGGLLRAGELYAVILFSRVDIPPASAARFRTIALDVRSALFALDESRTWRE
ncbi:MAG: hypothetical protein H0W68_03075 [Gemmatimonadaceae bacterium]|nr:hypothetical protein [Gemmatimonadaceae bacterium]